TAHQLGLQNVQSSVDSCFRIGHHGEAIVVVLYRGAGALEVVTLLNLFGSLVYSIGNFLFVYFGHDVKSRFLRHSGSFYSSTFGSSQSLAWIHCGPYDKKPDLENSLRHGTQRSRRLAKTKNGW